ncbi:MAG: F0F1 ATP synthase subunit B' [Alphaproteobacteria bacterium]|nr:F0F1 ATP synthase subunit B' [Alphaproteobacteria bacterium]
MPQFDPSSFPSQLFWLLVSFSYLFFLMSRYALPRIAEVLGERQKRIDDDIEKAAQLKTQISTAAQAYEKALADARAQAQAVFRTSQEEINGQAQSRNQEVANRLAQQISAGEARIAASKDAALSQVREIAAGAAEAVVGKLTGLSLDEANLKKAVNLAIGELGQ